MLSITHLLLVLVVIFVLFGAGKLPQVMGDIGKGMRSLREGMKPDEEAKPRPSGTPTTIDHADIPPRDPRA